MINASKKGYSDKWQTPKSIYDPLNLEFKFNYDPCPITWKEGDPDALVTEWGTSTFCNPPYSRVAEFVKKSSEEAIKGKTIVLLINTCTDTKWFHELVYNKAEIRFVKGRISFIDPNNPTKKQPSPRPSMIVIFRKKQDSGILRTNMKEQFYTNEIVAKNSIKSIINLLPFTSKYVWVEPSAGNGSFLHSIPISFKKIGLDLEPKANDILKQDFLKWIPPLDKDIIVFGNPPFGRQSSLARAFISKSCEFAKIIAFILPKSFTKPSMYNAFDLKFHLIHSTELDKDSFILNGSKYNVPCVFQIWKKNDTDRKIENKINPDGFEYVKPNEKYHIAFRRIGGLAGKCYNNDGSKFSIQSHYFIRFNDNIVAYIDMIIEKINNHIFPSNTVGPRSLSKSEVNVVINEIIQSVSLIIKI